MRKAFFIMVLLVAFAMFTGCDSKKESIESPKNSEKDNKTLETESNLDEDTTEPTPTDNTTEPTPNEEVIESDPVTEATKPAPEGDVVDGALTTKENPVPFGTWGSINISDGGWPKPAQARILNVITDQSHDVIVEHKSVNPLEEHEEFLEYVLVEYEVYFPNEFTTSSNINFYGLILSRENNQKDWIASDGSNYYWMGSVEVIDIPKETRRNLKNGDTVICQVVYPMIIGNTDYTLHYSSKNEDLSETLNTYFAIK